MILKIESIIISIHVNLKNFFALFPPSTVDKPPTHNNQGAVPSAKKTIISAPLIKFQVEIAYACIARVNQQGRKKVRAPVLKAKTCLDHDFSFQTFFQKDFGNVSVKLLIFGEISERLIPKRSIMTQVIIVMIQITDVEIENIDQNNPSIQPKNQNQTILHILKYIFGSNF